MKSSMPIYKDEVGSSAQKIRAVLQQRGTFGSFTSGIRDKNTAEISQEIVDFITGQLERYLAENAIETIDQISGRIQSKLEELDASDISVSDDTVKKLKDIFSG